MEGMLSLLHTSEKHGHGSTRDDFLKINRSIYRNRKHRKQKKGEVMSEVEKLILEKLDVLSQDVREVKEETSLARREAGLAREEATKAREEAGLAREEAAKAREEAGLAREEAAKAHEEAAKAYEEAVKAHEEAAKAHEEATKACKEAALAHEVAQKAYEEAVKANEKSEQAKNAISATQVFLENEISRKINIIGEGHEFLNLRLDDALSFKSKSERMELEVLDLRMEVKKIKAHLNIA